MTTTKTIVREVEADLVVREARTVADGVVALVLAEAVLEKFGGDSVSETARNHAAYLASIPEAMRTW